MMHFWTEDPVLFVEEAGMRNIDPRKPEDLMGIWSVFSKASGIMENGKRLEYMSWRLWQQQTLCPKTKRKARPSASHSDIATARADPHTRIPELSSSVDSACSSNSSAVEKHMLSSNSSTEQGKSSDAHDRASHNPLCCLSGSDITTLDLQNLVISIKENQELSGPLSSLPHHAPKPSLSKSDSTQEATPTPRTSSPRQINVESSASTIQSETTTDSTYLSPTNASETSVGSDSSQHSVVRGFEPGTGISTYRSQPQLAASPTPILKSSTTTRSIQGKKKGGVFQLGASSGEDESSLKEHMSPNPRSVPQNSVTAKASPGPKKQISFVEDPSEAVPKKRFMFADDDEDDGAAVESESEEEDDDDDSQDDEEVSESAIDDEDAWEDEGEAEEPAKQLEFHRVESKPDITSRRSILTDNLHESNRASALQNAAARTNPLLRRSRTSTPNGPSMPASPEDDSAISIEGEMAIDDTAEQSEASLKSRPIMRPTHNNIHPPCPPMSPRATRRNMVTQELGVSLRKHMLNERQYKNVYANSASPLRRAQTSTDVRTRDTRQEPGPVYPMANRGLSSNDDFDDDMSDYHRKGW